MEEHRLTLRRALDGGSLFGRPQCTAVWIMLNPSVANETINDPTILKVIGFSTLAGCSDLTVGNLFTARSTDPRRLCEIDPLNHAEADGILGECMDESDILVFAFGAGSALRGSAMDAFHGRIRDVCGMASERNLTPRCVAVTGEGFPMHPLYAPYPRHSVVTVDDVLPVWGLDRWMAA